MRTRVLLATTLALAACAAGGTRSVLLTGAGAETITRQCSRTVPADAQGRWAVPPAVIARLERDLPKLASMHARHCCIEGASVADPRAFHRQYAGVVVDGTPLVYINAFRHVPDGIPWREQPVLVCDGGASFWGALYDPRTGEFSQLAFNGRL